MGIVSSDFRVNKDFLVERNERVGAYKHLYTNARPAIVIYLLAVLGLELRASHLLGSALIA
jgi:hypothetical protein